ncbi:MAG: glycosyltransferase family 4 protein [Anaerolineae bacterium]
MRIGIDARLVYYSKAGIGQYIMRLVEALADLHPADVDFLLLQSRKDRTNLVTNHQFSRTSLWTPSHHRLEQQALRVEISPLRLDLLHSPDFIPLFRRNCASVITVHDLAFLLYPHFLTREAARYYSQIDQAVRSTDHIIAVSEATRQDIIKQLGVPEDKITVIHEAPHPLHHQIDDDLARNYVSEHFGIDTDYIFFVSTIEPRKNLPGLLHAYRRLRDSYKRKELLVLAGSPGWLTDEVFATVDKLNLEEHVIFLGRVPTETLLHLYNAARLLVHPSFYEGFGLPPLEAMTCGTPTIVSNISAMPEVVGDAALLINPHDTEGLTVAMWRVLTDEDLRANLIAKGLKRASCFSWQRAAEETLAVYRRVVAVH